jgi:DNA invertase Pin-like site-specific DNA recombinase
MMRDISTGDLVVDLILVDMLERFGRVEELPAIRKKLLEQHGILVLTADSNFADPTSPAGRALGMVETIRATEHANALAHNVGRGKRDAIMLKHWPGGKAPF